MPTYIAECFVVEPDGRTSTWESKPGNWYVVHNELAEEVVSYYLDRGSPGSARALDEVHPEAKSRVLSMIADTVGLEPFTTHTWEPEPDVFGWELRQIDEASPED